MPNRVSRRELLAGAIGAAAIPAAAGRARVQSGDTTGQPGLGASPSSRGVRSSRKARARSWKGLARLKA